MESLWSILRGCEHSNSSIFARPYGIIKINDVVYKISEPTTPLDVEIVFLHGLHFSDYRDAYWKNWMGGERGNEICWPMAWLHEDLPGARIWSLSYDSCATTTSTTGTMDAYLLGESLVQSMVGLANIGQEDCPIVFVCHCLGGLVAKEIVIKAHVKLERSQRKSKVVDLLRVINDELGRCKAEFERIEREHFANRWQFSVVAETHETSWYGFSAKVVEESSARHGCNSYLPIAADHFEVCKPESKVSSSYQVLRNFVQNVVTEHRVRNDDLLCLPSFMVGMEDRLAKIRGKLDVHPSVGLVGMGGIGKTTLSKELYSQEKHFEKSCFLEDVKSRCIFSSQRKLYSALCGTWDKSASVDYHLKQIRQCIMEKNVLLVVDDVGSEANLMALKVDAFKAGERGSKVILTVREQDILRRYVDREGVLDLDFLDEDQALKLFSHYAFDKVDDGGRELLYELSKGISKACGGLPLSLEVIGQYLTKYNELSYDAERKGLWEMALQKLQKAKSLDGSHKDKLWATLRISFDNLDEDHQRMFLDFACIFSELFLSRDFGIVLLSFNELSEFLGQIWGDPIGVQNLMKRSLIKWSVDKKTLMMHDQLRDLGRSIGNGSRIWDKGEGLKFMLQNKCSRFLEGLLLSPVDDLELPEIGRRGRFKMFLERQTHKMGKKNMGEVEFFERLRLLNLERCALRVVEYYVSLCSEELRWLCLNSTYITPRSIKGLGSFQKLRVLQMRGCSQIRHLPACIGDLSSLLELDLSKCYFLEDLPASIGGLESLQSLLLRDCISLKSLPDSIGELFQLTRLDCSHCSNLERLPAGKLPELKFLGLRGCVNLWEADKKSILQLLKDGGCRLIDPPRGPSCWFGSRNSVWKDISSSSMRTGRGIIASSAEVARLVLQIEMPTRSSVA